MMNDSWEGGQKCASSETRNLDYLFHTFADIDFTDGGRQ